MPRTKSTPDDDGIKEPIINEETLRPIIHNNLNQIQQGDCFVEHGLAEECFNKLLKDKETYGKFEKMLSGIWYNMDDTMNPESGLNGGKQRKKKKKYLTAVQDGAEFIKSEIEAYQHNLTRDEKDSVDSDISSLSTDKASRDSSIKQKKKSKKDKKKNKKKSSKKRKKRTEGHTDGDSEQSDLEEPLEEPLSDDEVVEDEVLEEEEGISDDEEELERITKRKAQFDDEMQKMLKKVPSEVKNDFTTVCFAKWSREVYPVLQINPFDIAPGQATAMWTKMYRNMTKNKNNRPWPRLVYWYGVSEGSADSFSLLEKNKIVSYKEGFKKKYNEIPSKIKKKQSKGKNLIGSEEQILLGLELMKKDLASNKEDIKKTHWIYDVDIHDYIEEYGILPEEEIPIEKKVDVKTGTKAKKKKVKKESPEAKKKKVKKESLDEAKKKKVKKDSTEVKKKKVKKDSTEVKKKKVKKDSTDEAKKKKGKRKKTLENDENKAPTKVKKMKTAEKDHSDIIETEQVDVKKKKKKRKADIDADDIRKKAKLRRLDEAIKREVEEEAAILDDEDDPPSDDDKNDDDFLSGEDTEEEDDDYVVEGVKQKKDSNKKTVSKERKQKDDIISKKALKRKRKLILKEHQNMFERCEDKLLPIVEKIMSAIKEKAVLGFLQELDENIGEITPSFIREHSFGMKIKGIRTKFSENKTIKDNCKQITKKMKSIYETKKTTEPEDFKPVKMKEHTMSKILELKEKNAPKEVIETPQQQKVKKEEKGIKEDMNVPKKGNTIKGELSKIEKPTQAKPARKSMKLSDLFSSPRQTIAEPVVKEEDYRKSLPEKEAELPQWLTTVSKLKREKSDSNLDRDFGLEFLLEATNMISQEKINPTAVANELEQVIFENFENKIDKYWETIHGLCAAITGKYKQGSLSRKLLAGHFKSPLEVIKIPHVELYQSFIGKED